MRGDPAEIKLFPMADQALGTNADATVMISQQPSQTRRALLLGLAALGGGGALATIAYPRLELGRLWYDVIGVDISNHQGDVDWQALAASNVAFAYIKATEGGDFKDKRFQLNWDGTRKAGLVRGAYHFFTQCRSGAEQAKNFIAAVPREPGMLPPVIDAEHMGPLPYGSDLQCRRRGNDATKHAREPLWPPYAGLHDDAG